MDETCDESGTGAVIKHGARGGLDQHIRNRPGKRARKRGDMTLVTSSRRVLDRRLCRITDGDCRRWRGLRGSDRIRFRHAQRMLSVASRPRGCAFAIRSIALAGTDNGAVVRVMRRSVSTIPLRTVGPNALQNAPSAVMHSSGARSFRPAWTPMPPSTALPRATMGRTT